MSQWVYSFSENETQGRADMRELLGGKGANLAEMASLGLPVPPGFTISTDVCSYYYKHNRTFPDALENEVNQALEKIEKEVGAEFGNSDNPLLVSVRSGARVSMPGMMDTVLNLGLNDNTVEGLAKKSGDERFAWDSYRRFIQMYSDVVLGLEHYDFEEILDQYKRDEDLISDPEIPAQGWREIVQAYKDLVKEHTGQSFPDTVKDQLWGAIGAVFESWRIPRAVTYRKIHHIPEEWGTAVNVQSMVFGNMGDDCATGVAFTRDPSNGENIFYGEFLVNAQGEDVVAGIRTPEAIPELRRNMPQIYNQLLDVRSKLEGHFKDMQDIEFTVQQDKLYMLQTRSGKRSAAAALKIAVEMVEEGLITQQEALCRLEAKALEQLIHPTLDPDADKQVIGHGLPASPGAASGIIALTADKAEELGQQGHDVILVRKETSPEDIHGMHAARGILTTRGGMTSHAAVVARGMGRPCVSGAGDIRIDIANKKVYAGDVELNEGDEITLDGTAGDVMAGRVPTKEPEVSGDFAKIMQWADDVRRLRVRTNAETREDAETALNFGAEGIGLCRTEHMFFEPERIRNVREMIFAENTDAREQALQKLLPAQRQDFRELFEVMSGLPVTIRLLDPPLHEFMPHESSEIKQFAKDLSLDIQDVQRRLAILTESNPMLGHRGCRLGLSYPEIYLMQVQAILEGALEAGKITSNPVVPEIMIPLVMTRTELATIKDWIEKKASEVFEDKQEKVDYIVGTMIELPRAALTADEIALDAEFFSFGTNDLTQTTLGLSRDDAGTFLPGYINKNLIERDPFETLDIAGVGALMEIAVKKGRQAVPDIKLGICGEHGGDPDSIDFCEKQGMDYVSCSPFRVPIARLAAAQAALRERKNKTVDIKSASAS